MFNVCLPFLQETQKRCVEQVAYVGVWVLKEVADAGDAVSVDLGIGQFG